MYHFGRESDDGNHGVVVRPFPLHFRDIPSSRISRSVSSGTQVTFAFGDGLKRTDTYAYDILFLSYHMGENLEHLFIFQLYGRGFDLNGHLPTNKKA